MEIIPYRDNYWNIPIWLRVVMFAFMAVSLFIMALGLRERSRLWRKGEPAVGFDRLGARLARTLRYAVAQTRIAREAYPAVMHFSIFGAMALLFIGTVLATIDADIFELLLDAKLLKGNFYLIYKLVLDLATLFGFIGLAMAVYRRYVVKPDRLNTDWRYNLTFPVVGVHPAHRPAGRGVSVGRGAAVVGAVVGGRLSGEPVVPRAERECAAGHAQGALGGAFHGSRGALRGVAAHEFAAPVHLARQHLRCAVPRARRALSDG